MILSIHAIVGAVLASNSNSIGQAIILGLVSHYFLDSIPHVEYTIKNIQKGDLKTAIKEFVNISIDLIVSLAILLYLIQNKNFDQTILILTGSFFALLPDGLYFIDCLVKNKNRNIFTKFLKMHSDFHAKTHSNIASFKIQLITQIIIALALLFFILFK
ncbi:MAG: hypothetical protein Q7S81_02655 [bacterium]|nr:hypothetical protein [bacterium]